MADQTYTHISLGSRGAVVSMTVDCASSSCMLCLYGHPSALHPAHNAHRTHELMSCTLLFAVMQTTGHLKVTPAGFAWRHTGREGEGGRVDIKREGTAHTLMPLNSCSSCSTVAQHARAAALSVRCYVAALVCWRTCSDCVQSFAQLVRMLQLYAAPGQ
jgi:hypothetical protein